MNFITTRRDLGHSLVVAAELGWSTDLVNIRMPDKRNRERVVAEISLGHVIEIAREIGRPLSEEKALHFLNHDGHAYAMWTCMMEAGEKYLKSSLLRPEAVAMACPVGRRRMTM